MATITHHFDAAVVHLATVHITSWDKSVARVIANVIQGLDPVSETVFEYAGCHTKLQALSIGRSRGREEGREPKENYQTANNHRNSGILVPSPRRVRGEGPDYHVPEGIDYFGPISARLQG